MTGLLADVNIQGHLIYLLQVIKALRLDEGLPGLQFLTFPDLGLPPTTKDRVLRRNCQDNGLVLFTDNRNQDGTDSLQSTLNDSLKPDSLPVITISDKGEFENSPVYAERVAKSVAEILFGLANGNEYRGIPRLYVPLPQYP